MLARTNRLLSAEDFRSVLRNGRRIAGPSASVSVVTTCESSPARFGVLVTKKVGNSVKRNLVRRRIRAIAWELVEGGLQGRDVVVRVSPSAIQKSWNDLRDEIQRSVKSGSNRIEGFVS